MTHEQFRAWLRLQTRRVLLAEFERHDGTDVVTEYLSAGGHVSAPDASPPNIPYDDRLTVPEWTSALPDDLAGIATPGYGALEISTGDGARDDWLDSSFDGRPIRLYVGDPTWPRDDYQLILDGIIADIAPRDENRHQLKLRDQTWRLNALLQTRTVGEPELISGLTYRVADSAVDAIDEVLDHGVPVAFTADAPNGQFTLAGAPVGRVSAVVRGGESTRGRVAPVAFGRVFNATPVLLDAGLHRYQVHDGPIHAIAQVRDDGIPVAFTANLARGTLDLAAKPVGTVTVDVDGATVGGVWLQDIASIVQHLLTSRGAVVDAASFAAFGAACPQLVELYEDQQANLGDVIARLVRSVGGFVAPDRAGVFRIGRMPDAETPVVARLTPDDILPGGLTQVSRVLPAASVQVGWRRNHTTQTRLAAAADESLAAEVRRPYRVATARRDFVTERWLLAREPRVQETCLVAEADANAEAERRADWESQPRSVWQIEGYLTPLALELGDVLEVAFPRFGFDAGRKGVVISVKESVTSNRTTVRVML